MIPQSAISRLLFILSALVPLAGVAAPSLNLNLPPASITPAPAGINGGTLPNLGNPTQQIISSTENYEMGQKFIHEVRESLPLIEDPVLSDYINALGMRLVGAANTTGSNFSFFVVNNDEINSFAGPGGYIGVNSGLILASQNESELAAVMAHEIAHVVNNDIAQKTAQATRNNISMLAAMLAGVAMGAATGNGQLGAGAISAGLGGSINSQLGFSREVEQNADQIGMQILVRAGFNPYAMPAFFERMSTQDKYNQEIPSFASNHPLTADRIAYTTNLASQYPKKNPHSSLEYYLNRERTRVDMDQNMPPLVTSYKKALAKTPLSPSLHYGYALALTRDRQFALAKQELQALIAANPNQVLYPMALARVELTADQPAPAAQRLGQLHVIYPDYYPLTLEYTYALIRAKQPANAASLLRNQLVAHPEDTVLYDLLAKAYANMGDDADAYATRAKLFSLRGDSEKAIQQLEIALKVPNISPNTRLQVQAQLSALQPKEKN